MVAQNTFLLAGLVICVAACGGSDSSELFSSGSGGGGSSGGGAFSGGASGGGASGGGVSGGGSGGSSAFGGSGGGSGDEDCKNGKDDNGDGLADCQDPLCTSGFVCVPPVPSGWKGVGFVDKQGDADCPPAFGATTKLYEASALAANPASCGCECGSPSGESCAAKLECVTGLTCSSAAQHTAFVGSCSKFKTPLNKGNNACRVAGTETSVGSCTPLVKLAATPHSWAPKARMCLQNQLGKCSSSGEGCAEKMPGAEGPCIQRPGVHECPAAFSKKSDYYDGSVSDDRGCDVAGCACGPSSGGKCQCSGASCGIEIYQWDDCSQSLLGTAPSDGKCISGKDPDNSNGIWGVKAKGYVISSSGSCSAIGQGSPTGSVSPKGKLTVCCLK